MGVTNGFLRLSRDEFSAVEHDPTAFEDRCIQDDTADYLDMDKAGYELLFILNPAVIDPESESAASPVPAIAQVLGGGEPVFPDIDLGYGPAQRVSEDAMKSSLAEFEQLDYAECYALASADLLSEMMLVEMDEEMFREYHWAYLQSLGEFIKEAVDRDMVVLRY